MQETNARISSFAIRRNYTQFEILRQTLPLNLLNMGTVSPDILNL